MGYEVALVLLTVSHSSVSFTQTWLHYLKHETPSLLSRAAPFSMNKGKRSKYFFLLCTYQIGKSILA